MSSDINSRQIKRKLVFEFCSYSINFTLNQFDVILTLSFKATDGKERTGRNSSWTKRNDDGKYLENFDKSRFFEEDWHNAKQCSDQRYKPKNRKNFLLILEFFFFCSWILRKHFSISISVKAFSLNHLFSFSINREQTWISAYSYFWKIRALCSSQSRTRTFSTCLLLRF